MIMITRNIIIDNNSSVIVTMNHYNIAKVQCRNTTAL